MPLRYVVRCQSVLASKTICAYYNKTFRWMCIVVLPYCIQLPLICNTCILMLTCVITNNSCRVWTEQNLFSWNSTVLNHNVFEPKWQGQTLQNKQWCISHTWQLSVIRITLLIPGSSIRSHSVCPSTWNNSAPTRKILMKFYIWIFFKHLSRKFKFH